MHPMHGMRLIGLIQKHGLTVIQGMDQKTWNVISRYIPQTEEEKAAGIVHIRKTASSENLSTAILKVVEQL